MKWCETNYKSTFFCVCWNGWGLHHFNTTPTHPIRQCTASLNTDSVIITHLSWNWSFRFSFLLWSELLHKEKALVINYLQWYISIKQYNRIALMRSLAWNCHLTDLLLLWSVTGTWCRSHTSHMQTQSRSLFIAAFALMLESSEICIE